MVLELRENGMGISLLDLAAKLVISTQTHYAQIASLPTLKIVMEMFVRTYVMRLVLLLTLGVPE